MLKLIRNTLGEGQNSCRQRWRQNYVEICPRAGEATNKGRIEVSDLKAFFMHGILFECSCSHKNLDFKILFYFTYQGLEINCKLRTSLSATKNESNKFGCSGTQFQCCTVTLKLKQFEGSSATVKFIRLIDRLFDLFNSRNPLAKGYKPALRVKNKHLWLPFLTDAYQYLYHLKDLQGTVMYNTRRKTGFLWFMVAFKSVKAIFEEMLESQEAPLKYLLTYKMSQDHLELFFAAVRSAEGFNNNSTTQQFTAAYKWLLMRSSIKGSNGNCNQQDATSILTAYNFNGKILY